MTETMTPPTAFAEMAPADQLQRLHDLRQRPEKDLSIGASLRSQQMLLSPESERLCAERAAEFEAQRQRDELANRQRQAEEMWLGSGVPQRHAAITEFRGEQWRSKCKAVTDRLGSGAIIALIGRRGTGKTQLAVEAIRHASAQLRRSRYAKALDVFLDVRASYSSETLTERDVVQRFLRPALLVIDEIHVRGEKPWEDMMLTHIIDKRYDAMLDTIIISNQTAENLRESLGVSIVDRIRECGGFIQFDWESFRAGGKAVQA